MDALNLTGNHSVAGEVGIRSNVDFSRKHILLGGNTVERLGLNSYKISPAISTERANQMLAAQDSMPTAKADQFLRYSRKTQSDVSRIAEKACLEIRQQAYHY